MTQLKATRPDARWAPGIYFVMGQVGWFACVLTAASGMAYVGIALVCALLVAHFWRVARPLPEVKLVATIVLIGGIWENAQVAMGLIAYPPSTVIGGAAPLWLPALWGLFAAQINTTYRWLKPRVLVSALFGAVAGPLSFHAGASLGALRFVKVLPATVSLAIGWCILLPTVILLSRHWDGVEA